MIRIRKSAVIPAVLSGAGVIETNTLKYNYGMNPPAYTSAHGVSNRTLTSMTFDNAIYGDQTVKTQLITDQHEKCCFCEANFTDNSYGDVEHFRPKKAYKKNGARGLTYPGYYWLAYNWDNLMFSCEKCNRSYKKNEFPLADEATRKSNHLSPNLLENEDSLLINPNLENPSDFIEFNEEVPVPVSNSAKGKKSISVFNLERMNNTRLEHLKLLNGLLIWTKVDPFDNLQVQTAMNFFGLSHQEVLALISDANDFFNNAAKDTAKFALCVRCKFPHLPTI